MILFILPLIALAANNLIGGIGYLFKLLFPPVLPTVPLSQPFTPAVIGGQCLVMYSVNLKTRRTSDNFIQDWGVYQGMGAISFLGLTNKLNGQTIAVKFADRPIIEPNIGEYVAGLYIDLSTKYRIDGQPDNCGDTPNPNPTSPIGGSGLPSSPSPVLYPPPNNPNNNWFPLIAGIAAVAATALTAATAAAAATATTAITAATAAATAATAASASAPSGSTTQKQADSQKLSADALVGIAQVLAEIAKQIQELEKEVRKLKTKESKKEEDDAKKVIRYDFGSANRDGFIKLYPDSNPDSYEATFVDVQIFNIPIGSGKYFGDKSPHFYKYRSLGQIHFVSPTFGILESREVDFARLSLNIPDNCFGFFYHFGLNGLINANLSAFYSKTEKQAV